MGFQADNPTDPSEIGKAAKRFFSDETSANCRKKLQSKHFVNLYGQSPCGGEVAFASRQATVCMLQHCNLLLLFYEPQGCPKKKKEPA